MSEGKKITLSLKDQPMAEFELGKLGEILSELGRLRDESADLRSAMSSVRYEPERKLPKDAQEGLEKRFAKLLRKDPIVHAWYRDGRSGGLLGLAVVLGEHRKVQLAQIESLTAEPPKGALSGD